jgi:signal transduction histidine kinase
LLLLAVALMAILIVGGGTLVARALSREMRVARLQADFVSAVSHEFRTPITTMRQLSEMLVHGRVSTDARRAQFYETLLRESNRLHRLVEGLLNFGRMESGAARFNFEQVDVSMLVREVVSEFREEAAKSGFTVELDERGGPMVVQGDRVSLASVLWNLLDNAVKYSPNCRTVWVETGMTNGRAEVAVRDRGLGIPHEEQGEVFRKFVRGAASKTGAIQGTGIGLAMAKQIVEAHKGTIRLESESGAGSRFVILLPAVE